MLVYEMKPTCIIGGCKRTWGGGNNRKEPRNLVSAMTCLNGILLVFKQSLLRFKGSG